jgi:hypothetical protein
MKVILSSFFNSVSGFPHSLHITNSFAYSSTFWFIFPLGTFKLSINLSNKDIIVGTYELENLTISINDEIVYDIDRKNLDENKFVDKLLEEYKKYLKLNHYG